MGRHDEFHWPEGQRAALSLSFDDARVSQTECGLPILNAHDVKATFYVSVEPVRQRTEVWREVVRQGHEIGNHSLTHPCSGNFPFSRHKALENYTLDEMEKELVQASDAIEELIGMRPLTFAYPCGQKFIGRGRYVQSYVPLVAKHFLVGRGAFDEIHNDPSFTDLAHTTALDADDASFEHLKALLDQTLNSGGWLILLGHDVGEGGRQVVRADALDALCEYALEPANGVWVDTVASIGAHIREQRGEE